MPPASLSSRFRRSRHLLAAAISAYGLSHLSASAQTPHPRTWTGLGADNNWSTTANWDAALAELSNYDIDLNFAGTTRLTSVYDSSTLTAGAGGYNVRNVTFAAGAGAFTISDTGAVGLDMLGDRGGSSTTNPALITNNSTSLQTISLKLIIRGDLTGGLTFNTASGDIAVTTSAITSTGTNGLVTKTGSGNLLFSAANAYAYATTISGGSLSLTGSGRLGAATNTATVSVFSTAIKLDIASGVTNGIANTATLSLAGGGTANFADNGYVALGSGINEIVGGLILGGVSQAVGTYGSTASAATFKNNEYFSGTGIVTVVPEPSNLVLAVIGGLGTLGIFRRRRR